jgi:AbrB family looped-hinge helix DNA binding protein
MKSSSNVLVKVQRKGQLTIPSRVRSAVGLADGGLVDIRTVGRKIVITPQLMIARKKAPAESGEYTPEQRHIIHARLSKALKGPFYGPFKNGAAVAKFLKTKQRAPSTRKLTDSR